ncbi:MAG TPA: tRNA dihydrouridine(20/20a) synthase DusA [Steroidobacteraceae bacterium]|nr:tRNA dihydrouridine(20/20a) synthase DusA [Steroidobacteraceae bacterium]
MKTQSTIDRRICVAPMMDYTDRHFRFLLRLLSPSALLYSEMINAHAIVKGDAERLLAFDPSEHPVALQLGGSDPATLANAASIGVAFGYDEINLNCGCPSDRVQSGRFGACLMGEPQRVAECVSAMRGAGVPVTVKCRIGIEPGGGDDDFDFLCRFIETVSPAGCDVFVVHARKAILTGLSPKQNREIPPLRYDVVERLVAAYPQLTLIANGGLHSVADVGSCLERFDGAMLGREICQNPYRLAELHRAFYDPEWQPSREDVVKRYVDYAHERLAEGARLSQLLRHMLSLFNGLPRARSWRRFIAERAGLATTTPDVLLDSLRIVSRVEIAA